MNWQSFFGSSGTADWILLTAFHSLWLSLAAFLIIRLRRFSSPVVQIHLVYLHTHPTACFAADYLVYSSDCSAVRSRDQKAAVEMSAATADAQPPLWNSLLNMESALPQARISRWKALMNQFGFLWLAVTLIVRGADFSINWRF